MFLGGYFKAVGFLLGHPPVYGWNFALRRDVRLAIRGSVVRNNADVLNDLDISYRLRPDMTVIHDRTLAVGVSSRPLTSWRSFRRHIQMSLATFGVEFTEEPPLRRRRA